MGNLLKELGLLLKRNFIAGLFIFIPIGVIAWLLAWVLDTLWQLQVLIPLAWRPENIFTDETVVWLVRLVFILFAALILALALSFLGWASKQYFGRKILQWIGDFIQRIPVIRSVYNALDQLLKTLASGNGKQFSRVVYVEYPRKGVWTLAFVTGPAKIQGISEKHLNIYVPTTPNPTSGFHLIVPEAEVRESHLKVEEAFRTILSLGIAQPEKRL